MPPSIDPETMNVDELPGIWLPVQWPLSEDDRIQEYKFGELGYWAFEIEPDNVQIYRL
jgi:hypothetical protein